MGKRVCGKALRNDSRIIQVYGNGGDVMSKKKTKVEEKHEDREKSTNSCYAVDPCGCYTYMFDSCGCYVYDPCCC